MKPCTGSIRVIAMSLVALATVVPARADSQATLVEEVRQATARKRPPQRGQVRISRRRARCIGAAQGQARWRDGPRA